MKPVLAAPATRALCLRIVPASGATIRLTDHVRDLTMSGGQIYLSTSGYQFSGYSATADFAPGSIDLDGICGLAGVTRAAIAAGSYDGARVYLFATSWASPLEDQEPVVAGILGRTTIRDDRYTIDGVALVDVLNQAVGKTYGARCPKTFLGQGYAGCKVPVAPNTVTGTLTHVTSASVFRDSARAEAADTFGAGTVLFTSGANAGLKRQEIKAHAANGTITLYEAFPYLPAVGDAYSMTRGCRGRLSDCQNRWNGAVFNNVLNFGGFPYIPSGRQYATPGRSGA